MKNGRVRLAVLREYRSANGNPYFSCFLGDVKLVLLKDSRATTTGPEVARWDLLIEPAPRDRTADPARTASTKSTALTGTGRQAGRPPKAGPRLRRTQSDSRARESLHRLGLDPDAPIEDDDLDL